MDSSNIFHNFKVAHIDKHRKGKRMLVASTNKKLVKQPSSFENYADVFAQLGYPVKLDFQSIFGEGKGDLSTLPQENLSTTHDGKSYPATYQPLST